MFISLERGGSVEHDDVKDAFMVSQMWEIEPVRKVIFCFPLVNSGPIVHCSQ